MELKLYKYIVKDIKERIEKGILQPGDKLPPELELCNIYDAGKSTIRQVLSILANEDYIYSIPRVGNYVNKPKKQSYKFIFDEMKIGKENIEEIKLESIKIKKINEIDYNDENIMPNVKALEIIRVYISSAIPIAYDIKYILYRKGLALDEEVLINASFINIISKTFSDYVIDNKLTIVGDNSTEETAKFLMTKEGSPLFVVKQTYIDQYGKPMGFSKTSYKYDFIEIHAKTL